MENTLFDIEEYTDPEVRRIMQGNTCRHYANRRRVKQGCTIIMVCEARRSGRSKSGQLRVHCDQPACILFTHKDNSKK